MLEALSDVVSVDPNRTLVHSTKVDSSAALSGNRRMEFVVGGDEYDRLRR